ncbi:hypothetical protein Tco_0354210, partial [Tanacetum coccineum]
MLQHSWYHPSTPTKRSQVRDGQMGVFDICHVSCHVADTWTLRGHHLDLHLTCQWRLSNDSLPRGGGVDG